MEDLESAPFRVLLRARDQGLHPTYSNLLQGFPAVYEALVVCQQGAQPQEASLEVPCGLPALLAALQFAINGVGVFNDLDRSQLYEVAEFADWGNGRALSEALGSFLADAAKYKKNRIFMGATSSDALKQVVFLPAWCLRLPYPSTPPAFPAPFVVDCMQEEGSVRCWWEEGTQVIWRREEEGPGGGGPGGGGGHLRGTHKRRHKRTQTGTQAEK